MNSIKKFWNLIYPGEEELFGTLKDFLLASRQRILNTSSPGIPGGNKNWFKKAVVYSLYVEFFAGDFLRLEKKLDYLQELGVDTLWILPILKSPFMDNGFDVEDYFQVREELLGENPSQEVFYNFVESAHKRGLRIIFDIPLNHCSAKHPFFLSASGDTRSPYRDYFIWNSSDKKYSKCRLLFQGLVNSNWEFNKEFKEYYFHRFYPFQPDFNFRNPHVFLYILKILAFWKEKGIDGFRLDAIPFLWKEDGTTCESLPMVHNIIKCLRSTLDFLGEDNLLLAEACQPPKTVVDYFGSGDEVHGAYHFPLMPQIFHALAREESWPVHNILHEKITPPIPENCAWFVFLRCHDEFTLEMVSEDERDYLFEKYCLKPEWGFREGYGISSRLAELLKGNPEKIIMAFSILLTLEGTPVIYYGDELALGNNTAYYHECSEKMGLKDSRFLVRGPLDWAEVRKKIDTEKSLTGRVFKAVKQMLKIRKQKLSPFCSVAEFQDYDKGILAYTRTAANGRRMLFLHNLSHRAKQLQQQIFGSACVEELLGQQRFLQNGLELDGYESAWLSLT
ncbi:alpha-amylase family glycosyl hydrolase [Candidatus Riflebacteria bacterium]